jgi:FkbM family methyltransferase
MILNTILCDVKNGFYIDVGANNPTIQSNTHFFYKKGWSGINIDALPGSMKKFNRFRPRDINLEVPISDKQEILKYYMFSPSFYNTFDEEYAVNLKDILVDTKKLQTEKLSLILDKYLNNRKIHFMTIDVEGLDFQVLKSNNWNKYRPLVIVIELFADDFGFILENEITNFLKGKGYSFYRFSPTNAFYIENEFNKIRFNHKYTFETT